ncbi:MAG TPA: type IV pili twitching motility protein PilT, partial [Candidatus Omnitrophota bacterium]|nr:type IV pili twitching motility protein PilT [Candidatus Omnitrophota bacterium]
MANIKDLLNLCIEHNASDLHLTQNTPPVLRVDGRLVLFNESGLLDKDQMKKCIYGFLNDRQIEKFEQERELDFSLSLE